MRVKLCIVIEKLRNLGLYQKFALAITSLGLLPALIIIPILTSRAVRGNQQAVSTNYEQAVHHVASSMENMLSGYDNAAQVIYHYSGDNTMDVLHLQYQEYDNLRQILEEDDPARTASEMNAFLRYAEGMESYISAVHFVEAASGSGSGQMRMFHYSSRNAYIADEAAFLELTGWEQLDQDSRQLQILPTHSMQYFSGAMGPAFTVCRNYYDLRGAVGSNRYIGTILIDVDVERLRTMFRTMHLEEAGEYFLLNEENVCLYATQEALIGTRLDEGVRDDRLYFLSGENKYGLKVMASVDRGIAYASSVGFRNLMIGLLGVFLLILAAGASIFSRQLTRPIYEMIGEMTRVESGDFDIHLPVRSHDEIGILSERFNEMSRQLELYIEKSYLASIRQNEAELTALKSQIYPHFLYNTLEIIRMGALENSDTQVSDMIEALSEQIHYIIGPMEDMVPLETEIGIIEKYIYLLNCRISGKVRFSVQGAERAAGEDPVMIPKLMLQPIVENAYVHGIKPKSGTGNIMIDVVRQQERLEISVIDNGVGMDEAGVRRTIQLLESDQPGIRNEYNWQSIGLKNVHDRLRYMYGEQYGIHVTSTAGVGTAIQISMPLKKRDNHDQNDNRG